MAPLKHTPRALLLLAACLAGPTGCLTPGDEPYAGWSVAKSEAGGFSLRYLAPPWEIDLATVAPAIGLEVPFQHAAPVGLPDPPPSYLLIATPGLAGATDALAASALSYRLGVEGDTQLVAVRAITTRSGLGGHEMISLDVWARFHREAYVALPSGAVVHLALESNDDADARDVDDLLTSLEAIE